MEIIQSKLIEIIKIIIESNIGILKQLKMK